MKTYSFISQTELEKRKEKALDKEKILSHGMDLLTSFRNCKKE